MSQITDNKVSSDILITSSFEIYQRTSDFREQQAEKLIVICDKIQFKAWKAGNNMVERYNSKINLSNHLLIVITYWKTQRDKYIKQRK